MRNQEAAILFEAVDQAWPRGQTSVEAATIILASLLDLPYDLTRDVITKLIMSSKFRPSVADIRLGVAKRLGALPPPVDVATSAAAVWVEHLDQLQHVNGSGWRPTPVEEPHPLIVSVLRGINYNGDHWMTQFQKAYAKALNDVVTDVLIHPLVPNQGQLGAGK